VRFAFVVSSGLGYQIPNLFHTEKSFEEFEKALKALGENGFDGVELNLHFDDRQKLSKIIDSIGHSGLKLASVGTGLLYAHDKLSFTDSDAGRRARALGVVKRLVEFAATRGAPVIIGLIRGTAPSERENATVRLLDALKECDSDARDRGTRIAVEAINRYETSFLNTASDVAAFIEGGNLTSTGILLDTFHMNIEERSPLETIKEYHSKLVHFHIADSNRWPPSYGHLKVEDTLHLLQDLGYRGWVSAETLPKPSSIEAVEATARFLRAHKFIQK
jgi:sugar phosphate isomerase/epimerase